MKSSILRTCLVGMAAAVLASCGGTQTFEVSGVVENHKYGTLHLVDINGQVLSLTPKFDKVNSEGKPVYSFKFDKAIEYGQRYLVGVVPGGMPIHQVCSVGGGTENTDLSTAGTAGQFASVFIGVECVDLAVSLGGRIRVVDASGAVLSATTAKDLADLQLTNGSDSTFTVTENLTFTTTGEGAPYLPFTIGQLVYGQTYGISVLKQPTGYNCAVTANGSGMLSKTVEADGITLANVSNVVVTCTKT